MTHGFSAFCVLMHVETQYWNYELVSLSGQQLYGRIRLFGEVPRCTLKLGGVPLDPMNIIQSSEREAAEERL